MNHAFFTSIILAPLLWTIDPAISKQDHIGGINTVNALKDAKFSFTIEGNLKNFKSKKAIIHIGWQEPWEHHEFLKVDMINGKFRVTGEISQPTLGSMRIVTYNDSLKPEQQYPWECDAIEFFLCSGKTTITGRDSLATAKIISTCGDSRLYQDLANAEKPIAAEIDSVTNAWRNAYAKKDSCAARALDHVYALSRNKQFLLYESFIIQHPSSYLGVQLLNAMVYQVDDRLRLNLALALFNKLSAPLKMSPIAVAVKDRLDQKLYPVVGKPLPPVMLKNSDETRSEIAKYKGKILLIDFWASWCSPCLKEFPDLIRLYEKYKDKGFEVIGISIDTRKELWLGAIKRSKLTWPQFIDEGPAWGGVVSRQFRVSAVPAKFLVNQDGVIIAKNLPIDQLEAKINALLKTK